MIYIFFTVYFLIINLTGYLMMYIDKNKAKNGNYRISEKAIFIVALLLGGTGVYIGMYKFRHKTRHLSFTVGIPICIVLNIVTICYILYNDLLLNVTKLF